MVSALGSRVSWTRARNERMSCTLQVYCASVSPNSVQNKRILVHMQCLIYHNLFNHNSNATGIRDGSPHFPHFGHVTEIPIMNDSIINPRSFSDISNQQSAKICCVISSCICTIQFRYDIATYIGFNFHHILLMFILV